MPAAIEITNVSKQYGHLWALKSVSLEIKERESVALLGPNGAGKTTLMKIIATHISPSNGEVSIFGKNAFKNGEKTRRRIGFAAHESFLYDELTIEENLQFYGKLFSAGPESLQPIVESLNLKRWYRFQVNRLSHGLRKRADIARALIHNPDLVLLDELFEGLDEKTCNILVDYLRNQQSRTIVISSHSMDWAKKLCDRGVFLDRGEIAQDIAFR
jgi:ABC-type multidrug transport system ATPase subunit